MDLELIFPMPSRVSINLPALLVPGVPVEPLLGVTGTSLGFGSIFWGDSAGIALGLNGLCSSSPMAVSHPPLIPSWMGEICPELGRIGYFLQISASSFSKLRPSALTSVLWSWRQAGAWCPPKATGVFIWEDAQGVLQPCPRHLFPAFAQSWFCFLEGVDGLF